MAKRFRFWTRKQGTRTTGVREVGALGEVFFFATLLIIGLVSLLFVLGMRYAGAATPLSQPGSGFWLVLIVLGSFILLGGRGLAVTLLQMGTSPERRSALSRQAEWLRTLGEGAGRAEYPGIPDSSNFDNSPGIRLAYRLPTSHSDAWLLIVTLTFSVVWNVLVAVLVREVWYSFQAHRPNWPAILALVPFATISGWTLWFLGRHMIMQWAIGPTQVEISEHPLAVGKTCRIFLAQSGRLDVEHLTVHLVCEERTTYQQGTDIRSDRQCVRLVRIAEYRQIAVSAADPFSVELETAIPSQGMHSFQSPHNAVEWELVVRVKPKRWPLFERRFPVIVRPAPVEESPHGTPDQYSTTG